MADPRRSTPVSQMANVWWQSSGADPRRHTQCPQFSEGKRFLTFVTYYIKIPKLIIKLNLYWGKSHPQFFLDTHRLC